MWHAAAVSGAAAGGLTRATMRGRGSTGGAGRATAATLLVGLAFGGACSKPAPPPERVTASAAPAASAVPGAASSSRPGATPAASAADTAAPETAERAETPEVADAAGPLADWIVDTAVPVAPAGPATASPHGIVLTKRNGEAVVARLGAGQPRGKKPTTTAIEPLELAPAELFTRAPPPAVAGDAAFFVHGGAVRRAELPAGGVSAVVTRDARDGGRVAAAVIKAGTGRPRVALTFLAELPSRLVARLFVEGAPSVLTLTPEGSEATTTALAALDQELIAVTLEARTGMSTVHARRIALTGDAPLPAEDVVVWVGGSAQAVTEVTVVAGPGNDSWAFTAIEHDATRFGLARIRVAKDLARAPEVFWRDYPNGADPAPVATGSVCGETVVLYARPSAPAPRSPQELHAATMGPGGLGPSRVVATAPAFANVSLATLGGGALVGYVAEGRTWATTIRCPTR